MEYEGTLSVLSQLAKGQGKTGLLVLSGGTRGVYGAAQTRALEERGLRDNFEVLAGISSGAGPILYFAGGVVSRGVRVYYEECPKSDFLSFAPRRVRNGTMLDPNFLGAVFRGKIGTNGVCLDAVKSCAADVVVGLTDCESGQGVFVDIKTAMPDPVEAVIASMAMPILCRRPFVVNGKRYRDGGVESIPFPARKLVEGWGLDALIVFANRPRSWVHSRPRQVVERLVSKDRTAFDVNLHYLRTAGLPYLLVWTDNELGFLEQRASRLQAAAERGYNFMSELLNRADV